MEQISPFNIAYRYGLEKYQRALSLNNGRHIFQMSSYLNSFTELESRNIEPHRLR